MYDGPTTDAPPHDPVRLGALTACVEALTNKATTFLPDDRVEALTRQWVRPGRTRTDDIEALGLMMIGALAMAMDAVMFQPDAGGATAIDRMMRRHKRWTPDETTVLAGLRRARFGILRIEWVGPNGLVRLWDLAGGETVWLFDPSVAPGALDFAVVTRVVPLDGGVHLPVMPLMALDSDGLAVAMGFVRPGSAPGGHGRITNEVRCVEAVYRHIARHPVRLPRLDDEQGVDTPLPFGPEDGPLHALADDWARRPAEWMPDAEALGAARPLAGVATVIEAISSAEYVSLRPGMERLADAYGRLSAILVETLHRRGTAGFAHDLLSEVASAIDAIVAAGRAPGVLRERFDALRQRARLAAAPASPAAAGTGGAADLDRLVARIRGLRAKTVAHGCTEAEALAAAEKVAELLDRHGLTLDDVAFNAQPCEGVGIDTGRRRLMPLDDCVPSIAAFFDCRCWIERFSVSGAPFRHMLFGMRADVAAAHYLYDLVERTFETELAAFMRGPIYAALRGGDRRSAGHSFQVGLARGITDKLRRLRAQRESGLHTASGRDLVPAKAALVETEMEKLGLSLSSQTRAGRSVMKDAFAEGQMAGERFEVMPGIGDARA